jgi:hypothetical protein
MTPYNGYKAEQTKPTVKLPAGGYVAKILKAEEVTNEWGKRLVISFDITEGEYKDHFKANYNNQTGEDKRWKGVYRLGVPTDDGSDQDAWKKRSFNNAMGAIEESNPGYHWDWNEAGLKGKAVGVLFRDKEWAYNGRTGWTTECCTMVDIGTVRNGGFTTPAAKPLPKNNGNDGFQPLQNDGDDDGEVPF